MPVGLFVPTFGAALMAIGEVKPNGDGTGTVPGVALVTAFVLVLASIAVLVIYVHHRGQWIRVPARLELVGKATRALIDRVYADQGGGIPVEQDVIASSESGVVVMIGVDHLVADARRAGCV